MRRVSWQPLVGVVLLALLATLATLQYRWLGEVSQAERERMRASLRTRASEFAQEFDAELTRTYLAFHVDGDRLDADGAATLSDAYARWQASTTVAGLVQAVYLLEGQSGATGTLRRFDLERHVLEPSDWPPSLTAWRHSAEHMPIIRGVPPPLFMAEAIDSRIPALLVSVPRLRQIESGQNRAFVTDPAALSSMVIIVLDQERLHRQLLEPLVAKYFDGANGSDYFVTIVRRDDPTQVVFTSDSSTAVRDQPNADVTTGLFDLRMDELNRLTASPGPRGGGVTRDRVAITIVRRANGPDSQRVLMAGAGGEGAWEARVRHRSGSLEAIVAQSRRRNVAISLGVLGLLAASFVLVIAAAQRQQRLARQQMDFVAAVSHELRTPLAVICSAGENLADGVVADATQVKRYGSLIETEGRRLGATVERVMNFAGITSAATLVRAQGPIDVAGVLADAVRGLHADARDRGVTIALHPNGTLPSVTGDRDALRSAIENVIGNAVKYSPDGATVDVTAEANGSALRIRIADRGLGIDDADLPHIFKPFYRGRRALDAQVRGTGVGLSVVRHVIDQHQGRIHIDSRPGEGTTVTLELPANADLVERA